MPHPQAVLFDFGGVLVRTESQASRRQWEARLGLAPGALSGVVFDSETARRATLGELPVEAVWAAVAERFGLDAEATAALRQDFFAGDRLDETLVALVKSLRPHYRTAILSNAWGGARQAFSDIYGLHNAVDDMIISAEVGLAKPDARIYHLAARRLGVPPEAAVLVDDFVENVEGARAAGLQAIRFTPDLDLRAALVEAGVEV